MIESVVNECSNDRKITLLALILDLNLFLFLLIIRANFIREHAKMTKIAWFWWCFSTFLLLFKVTAISLQKPMVSH